MSHYPRTIVDRLSAEADEIARSVSKLRDLVEECGATISALCSLLSDEGLRTMKEMEAKREAGK